MNSASPTPAGRQGPYAPGSRDLAREIRRTQPDFIAYRPESVDGPGQNTGNEHFLVFTHPNGELMAVWTQGTHEGKPDQRVVFARSRDGGATWSRPVMIAGPDGTRHMARFGYSLVSRSGRIYILYNRYVGVHDYAASVTGVTAAVTSDDAGHTWSEEQVVPMPRTRWDNPDPRVPANAIVWQLPQRLLGGPYFVGLTRWLSPVVSGPSKLKVWWSDASVVEFMRFDNVDADPAPRDLQVTPCAHDGDALRYGHIGHPEVSVLQEPGIVPLPDGRLFCIMRTNVGHPVWSESADRGTTWTQPVPLRQTDTSLPLRHPCSPCPIYEVGPGDYVFFIHNHDGHIGGWGPMDCNLHRRPIWLLRGQFRPGARQPVWFSEPQFFMDNGGVSLRRPDLAMYSSLTPTDEGHILWYPERKFFLLGKRLPRSLIGEIAVPER
ncbi:MAG: exo-alpha-sialidase [Opitutaceae bacterium]|nr:exo-alpha-sialidase [Opitutaceae bacterium]